MPFVFGAMPELWKLLLVVFVVIPVVKWSIWGSRRSRLGRRHAAEWMGLDADEGGPRVHRRDFEALKDELDGRVAELDQLHARVEELENRLDFTERLLAQRQDPALSAPRPQ